MSVLIKGMEMPKNCDLCPIMMFEDTNCTPELYCGCPIVFKAHPQGIRNRPEYCPLIELPPHGRLIDADAFCEKVLEIVERQKYDDFYAISLSVGAILREVVRELRGAGFDGFDNAPTIIQTEEGE